MADTSRPSLPDDWAERWAAMPAAEFFRWMGEQGVTAPHVAFLGYEVEEVDDGVVLLGWDPPAALLNPAGIVHGGFLAAMLDDACGISLSVAYPRWVPQMTLNLGVDYLAPVHTGQRHRVEGRVVRRGRTSSVADATIQDADGRLLCRATGIFQANRRMIPRAMWEVAGLA